MKRHLFEKIPTDILRIKSSNIDKIEAKFYWEEVKFITNEQAFEFMFQISQMFKQPECILTYALSLNNNEKARNEYLNKYLASDNVQYKDYAESLLKGTIRDDLKNHKLLIFSDFITNVRQKNEDVQIRKTKINDINQVAKLLETSFKDEKNRDFLVLNDLQYQNINDYRALRSLESFSFMRTVSKGNKTELHIFSPEYWQVMKKYGVNEIEFINCFYLDITTDKPTLESYKNAIDRDFEEVLNAEKHLKFFETYITSVRMIENGVMKVRHYSGEEKLKVKEIGYTQVQEWLKANLKRKDKFANSIDDRFGND